MKKKHFIKIFTFMFLIIIFNIKAYANSHQQVGKIFLSQKIDLFDDNFKELSYESFYKLTELEDVENVETRTSMFIHFLSNKFNLTSVDRINFYDLLKENIIISNGRQFNVSEINFEYRDDSIVPIIVSNEMFVENNWSLNEVLSFENIVNFNPFSTFLKNYKESNGNVIDKESYQFQIIGIFDTTNQTLKNTIYAPDNFVKTALEFLVITEKDYYECAFGHEIYWNDIKQDFEITLEYGNYVTDSIFHLKSDVDISSFVKEANEILAPNYEIIIMN